MLSIKTENNRFSLFLDRREIIAHTPQSPALFLGKGEETIRMFRGNFDPIAGLWAFLIGPMIGAALAAFAYKFIESNDRKLA